MARVEKLTNIIATIENRLAEVQGYITAAHQQFEAGSIDIDEAIWAQELYHKDVLALRDQLADWNKRLIKARCAAGLCETI